MMPRHSQQPSLYLVATWLALTSLWREGRTSLILRCLLTASAYAVCGYLVTYAGLKSSAWSASAALLGIGTIMLAGKALLLRQRRQLMAPLLKSMPVPGSIWFASDITALVIVLLTLSLPFLGFLYLADALDTRAVIALTLAQSVLMTVLARLGASGRAGSVAWSVVIVVIWAQGLDLLGHCLL